MTVSSFVRVPSAVIPLAMSAAALSLVGFVLMTGIGRSHDNDEGPAARLFQLLIVLQLPIVGYFALTWLPRERRAALWVLSLQIVAVVLAVGTIVWLERGATT